jgi:uncharacterized protein (TIGR02452 family)
MGEQDRKKYRTAIMNETLETLKAGFYINSKGEKVTLDLKPSVNSLSCQTKSGGEYIRPGNHKTQIFLENKDCLTVAGECVNRGNNPIVFDAASGGHFGGGYKTGAGAQEENMTRRSGLCIAADTKQGVQTKNFYPLKSDERGKHAVLYTTQVPVFRGEEQEGYPYLDLPYEISVAITAGYNFNEKLQQKEGVQPQDMKKLVKDPKTGELRLPAAEAIETKQKLRTALHVAQKNGHDVVVLVPVYCGAYRNPPKQICEMIMDLITKEFPHSFKEVRFAIIDDQNTRKAHNPEGNYQAFKETIEKHKDALQNIGAAFKVIS